MVLKVVNNLPSFFKQLLPESDSSNIQFVYNEVTKKSKVNISIIEEEDTTVEQLELTGQPLETELDDTGANESFLSDKYYNWTTEETCYYPIEFRDARKYINGMLRKRDCPENPILVYCNGNEQNIILLGTRMSQNIERIFIYTLPKFRTNDVSFLEQKLKLEEQQIENNSTKISYSMCKLYLLYGPPLTNNALENSNEYKGSVYVKAWCDDFNVNNIRKSLELNLHSKIGHKDSSLYPLWNDLCLLQEYYNTFVNEDLTDDTLLSCSDMDTDELLYLYNQLSNTQNVENDLYGSLNLDKLRNLSATDLIWKVFKECKNLGSLQKVLEIILNDLLSSPNNKVISEDEECAKMMRDLLEGRQFINDLHQPFQLLIDFGLAYLKQYYLAIFDRFPGIKQQFIIENWSTSVHQPQARRVTIKPTFQNKSELINTKKFSLLYQMHLGAEILMLSSQEMPRVSQETTQNLVNAVNKIITQTKDFNKITFNSCITKCCLPMSYKDEVMVDKLYPVEGKMQVKSVTRNEEKLTVHYFTKFPVTPNINCEPGETGSGIETYHVLKLVKLINPLL